MDFLFQCHCWFTNSRSLTTLAVSSSYPSFLLSWYCIVLFSQNLDLISWRLMASTAPVIIINSFLPYLPAHAGLLHQQGTLVQPPPHFPRSSCPIFALKQGQQSVLGLSLPFLFYLLLPQLKGKLILHTMGSLHGLDLLLPGKHFLFLYRWMFVIIFKVLYQILWLPGTHSESQNWIEWEFCFNTVLYFRVIRHLVICFISILLADCKFLIVTDHAWLVLGMWRIKGF